MIVHPVPGGGYWLVTEVATGRLIAQGCRRMCELVAAGRPVIGTQGSLI